MMRACALVLVLSASLVIPGCFDAADVNIAPQANDVSFITTMNTALHARLSATDGDHDALSYILLDKAALGNLVITDSSNGDFVYTPKRGAAGKEVISYLVNDGRKDSSIATLKIVIEAIADNAQQLPLPAPSPLQVNTEPAPADPILSLALAAGNVDLQISSATIAPGLTVSSGDTISVTLTVSNNGSASTATTNPNSEGFYIGFDLIRETAANGLRATDDRVLVANLGAGQTRSHTLEFVVPRPFWLDGDGQYYLKVIADSENNVLETTENNNELVLTTIPVNVAINTSRDISISSLAVSQSVLTVGDTLNIDNTVMHQNMSNSSAEQVSFWLATDEVSFTNGTAQLIGLRSVTQSGGMMGGHRENSAIVIPSFVQPGSYLVGAVADYFGRHNEDNTNNNRTLTTTAIQVRRGSRLGPDLVLENFSLTTGDNNLSHGEFFQVDLTITNQGDMPTFSSNIGYANGIPLLIEAVNTGGDRFSLFFEILPDLNAGQSISLTRWIAFQNTALFSAGSFSLLASIDPQMPVDESSSGKHVESNETNNQNSITINLSTPNSADLTTSNVVNAQTQVGIGQTVSYTYTVNNTGNVDVSSFKVGLTMKLAGSSTIWDLGTRSMPWLPAGGASSETLLLTVPDVQLSNGFTSNPAVLEIIATADSANCQFEAREDNNAAPAAGLSVFSDADLILTDASLAVSEVTVPATSTLFVTASNAGTTATEENAIVAVYLSSDGTNLDYIIGTESLPELAPGTSISLSIPLDVAEGITGSVYTVITRGEIAWDVNTVNNIANTLSLTVVEPPAGP